MNIVCPPVAKKSIIAALMLEKVIEFNVVCLHHLVSFLDINIDMLKPSPAHLLCFARRSVNKYSVVSPITKYLHILNYGSLKKEFGASEVISFQEKTEYLSSLFWCTC